MTKLLKLFSYIFHPLFIGVYIVLIYVNSEKNYFSLEEKLFLTYQISIITLFIPLGIYYVLKSINKADSLMLASVKQRKLPLAINCLLLLLLLNNSIHYNETPDLYLIFLGCLISNMIALSCSILQFKTSLHMIAIVIFTTTLLSITENTLAGIILKTMAIINIGFIASSRLVYKAHNTTELVSGTFIGLVPQIALYMYFYKM